MMINQGSWTIAISSAIERTEVRDWIKWTVLGLESLAVVIVIIGFVAATSRFLFNRIREGKFKHYRYDIGRVLLLVLEVLIAADIVNTIVLEATFESIIVLALLVVVRTFLGWTLELDMEGRWPWQRKGG